LRKAKHIRTKHYIKGTISLILFLIVSQLFTILIFIPLPVSKKYRQRFYKPLFKLFANFVTLTHFNIKSAIENPYKELFASPCIIVCNRQSIFELPFILGTVKKIVLISSAWHKRNPFYILLKRYVECYTISSNIEESTEYISRKISEGYFIAFYPESAKVVYNKVLRFHKGCFYYAEKTNTEILPIIFKATKGVVLTKWFFLKHGKTIMKIGKRIKPDDEKYSYDYSEMSKIINTEYRDEFNSIVI